MIAPADRIGGVPRAVLEGKVRNLLWDELADARAGLAALDYERLNELTEGRSRDLEHAHELEAGAWVPTKSAAHEPGGVFAPDHRMTDELLRRTATHRHVRRSFFELTDQHQRVVVAALGRCTLPVDVAADLVAAWGPCFGAVALEPAILRRAAFELDLQETPAQFLLRLARDDAETLFRIEVRRSAAARVTEALEAYQRARGGGLAVGGRATVHRLPVPASQPERLAA